MQNVTVYTKNNCVQCMMTEEDVGAIRCISYVEKNVEEDEAALTFLKDQGYQAVPVVFTNDAEPIKGFRPDLLAQLAKAM